MVIPASRRCMITPVTTPRCLSQNRIPASTSQIVATGTGEGGLTRLRRPDEAHQSRASPRYDLTWWKPASYSSIGTRNWSRAVTLLQTNSHAPLSLRSKRVQAKDGVGWEDEGKREGMEGEEENLVVLLALGIAYTIGFRWQEARVDRCRCVGKQFVGTRFPKLVRCGWACVQRRGVHACVGRVCSNVCNRAHARVLDVCGIASYRHAQAVHEYTHTMRT